MARRTETTDTSDERDRSGELRARDEPPDPAHERSAIAPPSLVLRSPRSPKSIDERDRERPVDAMLLAAERELIFASDPLAEELAARQLLALREIASEPEAGARHDASDVEHRALGEGGEVLRDDGRTVKVAFPATPAGVVEAALYELHRGEPRPLDEIARDPTAARWARGPGAATEGAARANDDAEPTAATAAERAVGLGARGTWETETRLLALRSKHARTIALLAKPLAERTGDEREVLRRARLDPTTRLELQALADAAR